MIEIIEGKLGGGKTFLAVTQIAARLSRGCHVWTNIELKFPGLARLCEVRYGVKILPEQIHIIEPSQCASFHLAISGGENPESAPLIVLDEAHLFFNARDWSKTSRGLLAFLTQSRKVCVDIRFISQSVKNVDSQFSRLAEFIWRCRDMRNVKILGFRWPMNEILALRIDAQVGEVIERHRLKIEPLVWEAYETRALLSDIECTSNRVGAVKLQKVKKSIIKMPKIPKIQAVDYARFISGCVMGAGIARIIL